MLPSSLSNLIIRLLSVQIAFHVLELSKELEGGGGGNHAVGMSDAYIEKY